MRGNTIVTAGPTWNKAILSDSPTSWMTRRPSLKEVSDWWYWFVLFFTRNTEWHSQVHILGTSWRVDQLQHPNITNNDGHVQNLSIAESQAVDTSPVVFSYGLAWLGRRSSWHRTLPSRAQVHDDPNTTSRVNTQVTVWVISIKTRVQIQDAVKNELHCTKINLSYWMIKMLPTYMPEWRTPQGSLNQGSSSHYIYHFVYLVCDTSPSHSI